MCGIAGYLRREAPAARADIEQMCRRMAHRGPDEEGVHIDGTCGIGIRRLSIIDLDTGRQPIPNERGDVWVVFNGEIYNYRELRRQLEDRGHRFRTRSDTEVIVHLYEDYGEECFRRLNGMFAIAVWDASRQQLALARDRFGKKPLYYGIFADGLYFASELACFQPLRLPLNLDATALRLYLHFGYIPDPYSAFGELRKLPPGTWLLFDRRGRSRRGRYWRLPPPALEPDGRLDEKAISEELRERFDEAVRCRLVADVPLGALLSGGLDSGSVVASMARQTDEPVHTFSVGFHEREFSELGLARLVARKYGADHREVVLEADSVDLVPRLVRHFGEPFADSSAIPTWMVSEFAARHVKVVLTGDGGDELFAGYRSLQRVLRLAWLDRVPAPVRRALGRFADRLPYAAYGKNLLHLWSRPGGLDRYFEDTALLHYVKRNLINREWQAPSDPDLFRELLPNGFLDRPADPLLAACYFEATVQLAGDMLVKVDRMSMAHSLEVRCPMLDHRFAEFAMSIPMRWKIAPGKGKLIFRRALGDRLPQELLRAPKKGFSIPLAQWFRGPLREMLWDSLTSRRFLERGFVNASFLRRLLAEHESGRRDHRVVFWMLLVLELWFREMEQEPAGTLSLAGSSENLAATGDCSGTNGRPS